MLTGALISALDKAESPRAVRAITWMLEKATGWDTTAVAEWYQHNGYYRIGGTYGHSTYTGKSVTPDSALEIAAFLACVKVVSEDMGALPHHTYAASSDRKQIDKAYTHPLYRCLHDLWNPEVSAGEGVEALTAHALMCGGGYAAIQRMDSGIWLWPWQPGDVRTDRNARGFLFYLHREGNQEKTYSRDQVFHLKGWTYTTENGDDLVKRARQVLGIAAAADEYAGRFFANDATPGVVLSFPAGAVVEGMKGVETVKAIKEVWKKWHQGLSKSHEPAVLQGGGTATVLNADNQKSQLIETRNHQVIEACRLTRVPPHRIAELSQSTNNNIEHQGIEYVTSCLGVWVDRWRRAVYRCLLTTDEQLAGRIWAEHDVAGILRGDFATQSEGFRKLLEKGVYSINEVRRWLNLNPVPDGDTHTVQLNMTDVAAIAQHLNLQGPN